VGCGVFFLVGTKSAVCIFKLSYCGEQKLCIILEYKVFTLSEIDVGQGIHIRPGQFGKKKNCRDLNKLRVPYFRE
jgi:hypothetical protein